MGANRIIETIIKTQRINQVKKLRFAIRYLTHKLFSGFHHLGWKVVFETNVTIRGARYMHLGNNVGIDSNAVLYVINHPKYKAKTPRLIIEDGTGIGIGAVILVLNLVHIKRNVMIGPNVVLADFNHSYQDVNLPIKTQGMGNGKPIIVEEGAWIGANVTICSGVTIGRNSVIGANSVVKDDIPGYSLAVGAPAKVVKKYNPKTQRWERIDKKQSTSPLK